MNNLARRVEIVTNIAIITVAVLLSVTLVRNYLYTDRSRQVGNVPQDSRVPVGAKITLPDVNWAENKRTLLMVLSSSCHFCTESAEFYQRLGKERAGRTDMRIVAVLPQAVSEGEAYLNKLGLTVDVVKQAPMGSVGVTGTPTLIMVNDVGAVTASWVGKLPSDKEAEVLKSL